MQNTTLMQNTAKCKNNTDTKHNIDTKHNKDEKPNSKIQHQTIQQNEKQNKGNRTLKKVNITKYSTTKSLDA